MTLYYYAGSTLTGTTTTTALANCTFSASVATSVAVLPRTDKVVAKDSAGRTASVSFSVVV